MSPHPTWLTVATSVLLALVGGYVDVVGFVLLFGLFVNHATGNLVMLGVSLAGEGQGLALKLLSLPTFIIAAGVTYACVRRRHDRGQGSEALILLLQAAMLVVFARLLNNALPAARPDDAAVILAGLAGVSAMAIQNVGARAVFTQMAPTTIMTGNVTQIAIDLVDLLRSRKAIERNLIGRLIKTWPPVAGFAAGAVAGAFGVVRAGAYSLLPAAAIVAVLGGLYASAPRAARA
ncbi:YoaK family protein [Caulobacter sp. UNC279MFTsu5.1]|uniref:YoaK family protein n=1 Tax=Caulobacter sp. UNC279MFTsu5.1 TaxID=1502775 RepID=UPI0008E12757|nr:YoaK family protein [Caulobacter sp. UNC279MFTsu5.1]SFI54080.1 Uncharacterized membrane protein YoaK, UPF0700 family [Caulobacter sp. UNC279MFTsu5.1]